MSKTYVSAELRRTVKTRANGQCEYCLIPDDVVDLRHEVDHIYAEKHGGKTDLSNLAHACFYCNSNKGSDIASFAHDLTITRFFHPRNDVWSDHFRIEGEEIVPITPIGEATNHILQFNTAARRSERRELQELERYPKS